MGPRPLSAVVGRPLNFTVRPHVQESIVKGNDAACRSPRGRRLFVRRPRCRVRMQREISRRYSPRALSGGVVPVAVRSNHRWRGP